MEQQCINDAFFRSINRGDATPIRYVPAWQEPDGLRLPDYDQDDKTGYSYPVAYHTYEPATANRERMRREYRNVCVTLHVLPAKWCNRPADHGDVVCLHINRDLLPTPV